jgi:hypothetical protein
MADGQKTEKLTYVFGTCAECNYTVEQLVKDYPNGTRGEALEATAMVTAQLGKAGEEQQYLVVSPHRTSCSLHTNGRR